MRIAVLGGYGGVAQVIVRDLIESPDVKEVAICGRSLKKAESFAEELRDSRAVPIEVDVSGTDGLRKAIKGFDVAVNATWYEHNLEVMKAAIDSRVPYVDLGGLYHMTLEQLKLNDEAEKAGVTCLLGMGSTPGTMNVMASYAARKLDYIDKVRLRSGYAVVGGSKGSLQMPYSFRTILDEFSKPAPILSDGKISMAPPLSMKKRFSLPLPVGEVEGYVTIHSELATLPGNLGKGVSEMDFAVAYEPEFTNTLSAIVGLGLAEKKELAVGENRIAPFELLSTIVDSMPKEVILDVDVQRVEIEGRRDNESVTVKCDSITFPHDRWNIGGGMVDTGVPASIAAQWIAKGKILAKGVVSPESCIDPSTYFKELNLRDRGIKVYENFESCKALF